MKISSLKNLAINTASVTIDIIPLSIKGNDNDLAKISVGIELESPLAQDTIFLIPNISDHSTKIYLPSGEKVELGDEDPIASESITTLQSDTSNAFAAFIQQPSKETMNSTVSLMADYLDVNTMQPITLKAGEKYITLQYSKIIEKNEQGENILKTNVPLYDFIFTNQGGNKANIVVLMPFDIQDPNNVLEAHWNTPGGETRPLDKGNLAGKVAVYGYWQYDPEILIKYKY